MKEREREREQHESKKDACLQKIKRNMQDYALNNLLHREAAQPIEIENTPSNNTYTENPNHVVYMKR